MSGSSYILDGGSQDLSAHAGHRIEVTGTLSPSMSGSAGSAPTGSSAGATSSAGASASSGQHLQVTSVKMISANCSAQ
jgi:hypothetical protein